MSYRKIDGTLQPLEAVTLVFSGDHRIHTVLMNAEAFCITWDDVSRELTVDFSHASEHAAEHLFWELLRIVPELRKDRR